MIEKSTFNQFQRLSAIDAILKPQLAERQIFVFEYEVAFGRVMSLPETARELAKLIMDIADQVAERADTPSTENFVELEQDDKDPRQEALRRRMRRRR